MHSPHAAAATARSYQRLLPVIVEKGLSPQHRRTIGYSWNIPKQLPASSVYKPQIQGQKNNERECRVSQEYKILLDRKSDDPWNPCLWTSDFRSVTRYCVPIWIAANPAYCLASLLFACIAFHRSDVKVVSHIDSTRPCLNIDSVRNLCQIMYVREMDGEIRKTTGSWLLDSFLLAYGHNHQSFTHNVSR